MKASIIVTSHNYAQYLQRCLRSCLSQNYPRKEYEVISVDDASTDNSVEILEKFTTFENFRYIVNETNLGVAGTANVGIRACLGRYFVRVDADDYINENLLLFLVYYLEENHDAFCVSSDYYAVDEHEDKIGRKYAEQEPISCGILYRTDLINEVGFYDSSFQHREEEELRRRLGSYYRIHHLGVPLYRYRMHGENKTKKVVEMERFKRILDQKYPLRRD